MAMEKRMVIKEADLECGPVEYNGAMKPAPDVESGPRYVGVSADMASFFWHTLSSKFPTFSPNLFPDLNLTDVETSYKPFKACLPMQISLREGRFWFEPEISAKTNGVPGMGVYEVGISCCGRTSTQRRKPTGETAAVPPIAF